MGPERGRRALAPIKCVTVLAGTPANMSPCDTLETLQVLALQQIAIVNARKILPSIGDTYRPD